MIEVKNVTKKYGSFVAVDDISFTVNDGEVVGFLGPNGAGKSTTMNMITGFTEPTEGTIIVDGYDISKKPLSAKKSIGYMPEGVPLYSELTVKEFVSYMADLKSVPGKERKEKVSQVLEETGLTEVSKKLIRNLSRGYKQRVSLAGALIGDPKVIILDEPTVGLDPKQITDIRKLIKELGKKHTVILSSHILSEVSQICEKVIIINKGKIIAVDTPENLEKNTQSKNVLILTVEDKKNNMEKIQKEIPEILECKFIKDNDDGTKQYEISSNEDADIRKKLFDILPKKDITIFELKKAEASLEDAFMVLINEKEDTKTKLEADENKEEKVEEKVTEENKEQENESAFEEDKQEEIKEQEEVTEENEEPKEEVKVEEIEEQKEDSEKDAEVVESLEEKKIEDAENKKESEEEKGGNE